MVSIGYHYGNGRERYQSCLPQVVRHGRALDICVSGEVRAERLAERPVVPLGDTRYSSTARLQMLSYKTYSVAELAAATVHSRCWCCGATRRWNAATSSFQPLDCVDRDMDITVQNKHGTPSVCLPFSRQTTDDRPPVRDSIRGGDQKWGNAWLAENDGSERNIRSVLFITPFNLLSDGLHTADRLILLLSEHAHWVLPEASMGGQINEDIFYTSCTECWLRVWANVKWTTRLRCHTWSSLFALVWFDALLLNSKKANLYSSRHPEFKFMFYITKIPRRRHSHHLIDTDAGNSWE